MRDPLEAIPSAAKDGLHGPFITLGLIAHNEVRVVTAAGKRLSEYFECVRALALPSGGCEQC